MTSQPEAGGMPKCCLQLPMLITIVLKQTGLLQPLDFCKTWRMGLEICPTLWLVKLKCLQSPSDRTTASGFKIWTDFFALSYTNWQIIRHTTILPGKNMKASSKHLDKVP